MNFREKLSMPMAKINSTFQMLIALLLPEFMLLFFSAKIAKVESNQTHLLIKKKNAWNKKMKESNQKMDL